MPEALIVVGASGLAKDLAHLARSIDPQGQRWPHIAYCSADASELGRELLHGRVETSDTQLLACTSPADIVIAIGTPALRQRIAEQLQRNSALHFPNLVHPSVELDASVRLGRGNAIPKGVTFTCDTVIGDFNVFGCNATIGHDDRIGSFNVINPGCNVSGWVTLGDACLLGTGSQVLERLSIASNTTLGAGAVLTRSANEAGVYVGVPARRVPAKR
jgi:sugar O-acyltransferase (sialic acid O-acetyltransferase NeuD family)